MTIRLATPADSPDIAKVFQDAFTPFQHQYTPDAFANTAVGEGVIRQRMEEGKTWIAVEDGEVLGTVTFATFWEGLYVTGMAVSPKAQGKKLGNVLMSALLDYARENGEKRVYLYTTTFLHRAIALYEKLGFTRYGNPADEFLGTQLIQFEKFLEQRTEIREQRPNVSRISVL